MTRATFNPSSFMESDDTPGPHYQAKYANLFKPGDTVLDVGCGRGRFLEFLREIGVHGVGVDSFGPAVEACRQRGLDVHLGDIFEFLETTDRLFDGVVCSHIIEHCQPPQAMRVFAHAFDRLRPDGRLIVITPNFRNIDVLSESFWLDTTHVRPYPMDLLQKLLEHAGFTNVRCSLDPDTGRRPPPLSRPRKFLHFYISKLRFGEFFGGGDAVVIGRRPANAR